MYTTPKINNVTTTTSYEMSNGFELNNNVVMMQNFKNES